MAAALPAEPLPITEFPADLIGAVVSQAERNAEAVASLLDALGFAGTPENPVKLDADFLLELAAAMQLLEWERAGLFLHRNAGLPSARDLITSAFTTVAARGTIPPDSRVRQQVVGLLVERFAWHGHRDWNAPLALDPVAEDALDAIAEFLWAHRAAKGTVQREVHPNG